MLEWIAMFSMLIDHIGYTFFPYEFTWRVIGRLAFPLYTYLLVRGLVFTKNKNRYLLRLFYLALLSQVPFMLLFEVESLNVIFTLFLFGSSIVIFEKTSSPFRLLCLLIAGIGIFLIDDYIDYGFYGYILFLIYYFFKEKAIILLVSHLSLDILYNWNYFESWYSIQSFSIFSSLIILSKVESFNIKTPRVFYRAFYPLHLLILYFISKLL